MRNHYNFLLFVLIVTIFQSCSDVEPQSYFQVRIDSKNIIGVENGNENEIIGLPSDFVVDEKGNIYVADMAFKKIKKYSSSGKFLKSFGKGEGKGPEEFLEIRGIDIDSLGNLYVVDMRLRRVSIFNKEANLIGIINTKYEPAFVQAFSTNRIYVIGFPYSYEGDLLYQYDLSKKNDEPVEIFCSRYKGSNQFEIENCGMVPKILKDNKREILFCSDYFPYRTRIFNINHNVLFELSREVAFFKPPYIKQKNPLYVTTISGIYAIARLNKNILIKMLLFKNEQQEKMELFLDFWDLDKRIFLGSVSQEELGINIGRYIYADENGYFYNYEHDPYPHITKYKMNITNK